MDRILEINKGLNEAIILQQFDRNSEKITIKIESGLYKYNLTGLTASLNGVKADGNYILIPVIITNAAEGLIEISIIEQMTVVKGTLTLQFMLLGADSKIVNTTMFSLFVKESIAVGTPIISTNDFQLLSEKLIEVQGWNDYFDSANGLLEEKYTTRLNGVDSSILDINTVKLPLKIDKTSIINDLTTGGTTKVLSAEQGKVISSQLADIMQYKCNNSNFLSKIGSNRTLTLTEDVGVAQLDLTGITNLKITSENNRKRLYGLNWSYEYTVKLSECSNITFENIQIEKITTNPGLGALLLNSKLDNIRIINCYFKTDKVNGIAVGQWLDSDNFLNNIEVKNCTFDVGRMCIEITNNPDAVRYQNVNIIGNYIKSFGTNSSIQDGERLAISLVGLSKSNSISNNVFETKNGNEWCIEVNGQNGSVIEGNIFKGNGRYAIHTTSINYTTFFSDNIVISNNVIISNDYSSLSCSIKNVKNSIVSNNNLNKLSVLSLSQYNLITCNTLKSSTIDGVLSFGGSSIRNKSTSNTMICSNTDINCRGIFISGEGTTENTSIYDTVILPTTATGNLYFQQLAPATGNSNTGIIGYKK